MNEVLYSIPQPPAPQSDALPIVPPGLYLLGCQIKNYQKIGAKTAKFIAITGYKNGRESHTHK